MSINVGVVGMGIGSRHVENLENVPDAKIVAVADLDLAKAQEIGNRVGARAYPDWQSMLEGSPELDVVILATPASVRREPIRAICDRKIALFCEKPPALSSEEAKAIQEIIEESGVLNTVGFMYRWNHLATRMRELVNNRPLLFARSVVAWPILQGVEEGYLPKVLFSKAKCGGPLIEQAIHFQDVLRYVTGDDPVSVQAVSTLGNIISKVDRDCEETTAYVMQHASGMLSTHIQNWSHKGTLIQLQVVGEELDLTMQMEEELWLRGTVDGVAINEVWEGNNYYEEMVGLIDAVQKNDQSLLRSPYADACRSFKVCEAATEAVFSGTEVSIEYADDLAAVRV
jgi:predicted dehydrogenase